METLETVDFDAKDERFLTFEEVKDRTKVGRTRCYQMMKAGLFPRPVELGGSRAVGWRLSEILAWMASRKRR